MIRPWMKWYPADWRADPRLRMCSLAARGLWADLLSYMHEGKPYGHLTIEGVQPDTKSIAALVARPMGEVKRAMDELELRQVFSRTAAGIMFSRRMVRDQEREAVNRDNGKAGGHPDIRRGTVPKEQRVRPFKRSDAPGKTQRIVARSDGNCHWCKKQLDPNLFHIDHVVAVRDGGTNDEFNLVAACPHCNGERAMTWGRDNPGVMVGIDSDSNPQSPESRVQKKRESGARAGDPEPLISQGAMSFSDQLLAAIRANREAPEWCGFAYLVQTWITLGCSDDLMMKTVTYAASRSARMPNQKYLDTSVRGAFADEKAKPERMDYPHGKPARSGGLRDAIDELREGIAEDERRAEEGGADVVRLLPGGRRA